MYASVSTLVIILSGLQFLIKLYLNQQQSVDNPDLRKYALSSPKHIETYLKSYKFTLICTYTIKGSK